ncbi:unnamed protein product [Closterium sp. Naga37s-1]|nr:unnamed protein product [Closterium sp. Naga37s-1]
MHLARLESTTPLLLLPSYPSPSHAHQAFPSLCSALLPLLHLPPFLRPTPVDFHPSIVRHCLSPSLVRIRPAPRPMHRQPFEQPVTSHHLSLPHGYQRVRAGDVAYDQFKPADVEYDPFQLADVARDASLPRVLHEGSEGRGRGVVERVREMGEGGSQREADKEGGAGGEGRERREGLKRELGSGEEDERKEKERRVEGRRGVDSPASPLPPPAFASHPPPGPRPVIIWDLDETLIIFQSLLSGKFAKTILDVREAAGDSCAGGSSDGRGVEERARELGEAWERLILDVCDDHFFFKELEDVDLPNLRHVEGGGKPADVAAPSHCDGSIPGREKPAVSASSDVAADVAADVAGHHESRMIAERNAYLPLLPPDPQGISSLLTPAQEEHRQQLYAQTDKLTHGWLRAGRAMLAAASTLCAPSDPTAAVAAAAPIASAAAEAEKTRAAKAGSAERGTGAVAAAVASAAGATAAEGGAGAINVVVSSGQLIPTLAKCLLFGLDPFICPTNSKSILSSARPTVSRSFHLPEQQ